MNDSNDFKKKHQEKIAQHRENVIGSQQYQQEIKYLNDISMDAIQAIRTISLYSLRAKFIYDEFLSIQSSDDLLQSIIGIRGLVANGIHNMPKRELRYLIEMTVKYLIVDQEKMGQPLAEKTQYLANNIPNASIDVIDRLSTPFDTTLDKQFKNEVKDLFYKACAYVHPSKRQIEEQIDNYTKGVHIGFETARMLSDINKLIFRSYDMILTLLFIGFGPSMSGDIFINIYDGEPKWKFNKGKYIQQYSKLFDYKAERQKDNH